LASENVAIIIIKYFA